MSRPFALLRPEPGWSASAVAAREMGLEVTGHPLSDAQPLAWTLPQGRFDALLIGSAAAFQQGGRQLAWLRDVSVHAVGESTAAAALAAGFTVSRAGTGGLQALLDETADVPAHYLRIGGEERVALVPHPGQRVTEIAVYRMVPRELDAQFASALATRKPVVALHSAAAARHFADEIDRLGLARGELFLLALGPRVAKAAGLGWAAVHLAASPTDAALLAKAAALCE